MHMQVAAYALDALDGEDAESFREHLDGCADCLDELEGLREAAVALALDVAPGAPPPALRRRVAAAVADERAPAAVVPLRRRWALPAAGAVAVVAAAAAVLLALWGISANRSLDDDRAARRSEARALAVLTDPTARHFPLVGARGSVVVTSNGKAALVVSALKRAPGGKTYELWVVHGGPPRPAGLFKGGGERTLVALERGVPKTSQVAVSLEPAGGSTTPTMLLFGAQTA
jgi:anti-sigma-K factor RskA